MAHRAHRSRHARERPHDDSQVTYVYYSGPFAGDDVRMTSHGYRMHDPPYAKQSGYSGESSDEPVQVIRRSRDQTLPVQTHKKYVIRSESPRDIVHHHKGVARSVGSTDGKIYLIRDQIPRTLDSPRSKKQKVYSVTATDYTDNAGKTTLSSVIPVASGNTAEDRAETRGSQRQVRIADSEENIRNIDRRATWQDTPHKTFPETTANITEQRTTTEMMEPTGASLHVSDTLITPQSLTNINRVSVESQTSLIEDIVTPKEVELAHTEDEEHNETKSTQTDTPSGVEIQVKAQELSLTEESKTASIDSSKASEKKTASSLVSDQMRIGDETESRDKTDKSDELELTDRKQFPTIALPSTRYPKYDAPAKQPWYYNCLFGRANKPGFKKNRNYWLIFAIIILLIVLITILFPIIHYSKS